MKVLTLFFVILLGACTTASINTPDGTSIEFTRLWSDVSFSMSPDGSMSYSSDAESSSENTLLLELLRRIP